MINFTQIPISGYHGMALINTLYQQQNATDRLAIVFPGLNFSVDMPLLNLPARLLVERGFDVLLVETNYGRRKDFLDRSPQERVDQVTADARAALDAALAMRKYNKIVLIGKSIGTRALGVLASDVRLKHAQMIWLTPLLTDTLLCEQIIQGGQPGLFVIGTADTFYQADILSNLVDGTRSHSLVILDADHGLNIPGQFWASFQVLEEVLQAVETFLDEDTPVSHSSSTRE